MSLGREESGIAGRISCEFTSRLWRGDLMKYLLLSRFELKRSISRYDSKLPAAKGEPATHTLDFTPMSAVFMERMLTRIREDCGEALRIFGTGTGGVADGGAGASVVKRFVDRLVGEVVRRAVSYMIFRREAHLPDFPPPP